MSPSNTRPQILSLFIKARLVLITLLISTLASVYSISLLDQYIYQQKQNSIRKVAGSYVNHIRNNLNQALSAAYPIAALIRTQNGETKGFEELASEMLSLYPGLDALQLHKNGILTHVVPLKGNESAIGNNVLENPLRTQEAFLAKKTGKLTLAGPFELFQGGMGAAARLPVYLDTSQGNQFWGFATALIRFPDILQSVNLAQLPQAGIGYELSKVMPDTNDVQIIATSDNQITKNTVDFNIQVPNGVWVFKAYPIRGWQDNSMLLLGIAIAVVFTFLTTLSSYLITRLRASHLKLEKKVEQRTHALQNNIKALTDTERRLLLSQKVGGIATWEWDIKTNIIRFSEHGIRLITGNVKQLEMTKNEYLASIHPDDRANIVSDINQCIDAAKEYNVDHRIITKRGNVRWFNTKGTLVRDSSGSAITMLGVSVDITERKLIEEKLHLSSRVFRDTHEGIIITNADKVIVDVNPAFCHITGYSHDEVIGRNPSFLNSGKQTESFYKNIWKQLSLYGHWQGEVWNCKKDGELYAELLNISVLKDDNNVTFYLGIFTDITQAKRQQEQLSRIAHYDLLTNLPNRVLLADRLSQTMLQCRRLNNSLAVVFLDLDGFKHVNDSHGHDIGDKLLIALSIRLKDALREGDSLARIGGDEFVAVLTNLGSVADCVPVLERLLAAAAKPVTVNDIVLNVSASIGVTIYPEDNLDAEQLMRHADQAMYIAKQMGKNRYHLFDTSQGDTVKLQQTGISLIREALANNWFVLYYQPKVDMRTGSMIGVEALIRLQHPERGLLSPIEFLPVIENNALMIDVGEWVINAALSQINQWQILTPSLNIKVSVNVAAVQLQQPEFKARLTELLLAHPQVDARNLELEVLETSALKDVAHVSKTMQDCKALGVEFSLDDFGTGYSSLTYLRRLPASLIKIDQSFVRDMLEDSNDLAIVKGVIALANSFKRSVIAEGVETPEHAATLMLLGCYLAQGYGIAKPMKAEDIPIWLDEWTADEIWALTDLHKMDN
ncbi:MULTISPECIES: bifunctional diguanylate cyclase/phosphodiesterase [unclassified Pseudoalteromonas]|uniref:bifunctional diguanylate cyclase/phosphodiesterase n=1 Tax=unclassified Pseudoalteromonas TaxID=194690 RepID=UPI001E5F4AE6|nr:MULTISPECIES: EAL domain-containing protein [unclassified Pseudoalteromonas]